MQCAGLIKKKLSSLLQKSDNEKRMSVVKRITLVRAGLK
jgi:hypothetical protein